MTEATPLRVVQWTTGNIAQATVRAVLARPDLELVGVFAHSTEKVGRDVGELCRLDESLGITATDDVDALLALEPDCVLYTPLYPDVAELVRILGAGVNVVTTSELLTGRTLSADDRTAIEDACATGGATFFGTGMNPGWIAHVAGVIATNSLGPRHVRISESVDCSLFAGDPNFDRFGWGRPAGDPGHGADVEDATRTFAEGVDLLARLLDVDDAELRCDVTFAHALDDLDLPGRPIPAGTVAGMDIRWSAHHDGRQIAENLSRFVMTSRLDTGWTVQHAYVVEVEGDPQMTARVEIMPDLDDLSLLTTEAMHALGFRIAGVPAANAVPSVCAAEPGIRTYVDIPLVRATMMGGGAEGT